MVTHLPFGVCMCTCVFTLFHVHLFQLVPVLKIHIGFFLVVGWFLSLRSSFHDNILHTPYLLCSLQNHDTRHCQTGMGLFRYIQIAAAVRYSLLPLPSTRAKFVTIETDVLFLYSVHLFTLIFRKFSIKYKNLRFSMLIYFYLI